MGITVWEMGGPDFSLFVLCKLLKCGAGKCGGSMVHFSGMFDVVIESEFGVWTTSVEFIKTEHFIAHIISISCDSECFGDFIF